jgi:hypothetical protein
MQHYATTRNICNNSLSTERIGSSVESCHYSNTQGKTGFADQLPVATRMRPELGLNSHWAGASPTATTYQLPAAQTTADRTGCTTTVNTLKTAPGTTKGGHQRVRHEQALVIMLYDQWL